LPAGAPGPYNAGVVTETLTRLTGRYINLFAALCVLYALSAVLAADETLGQTVLNVAYLLTAGAAARLAAQSRQARITARLGLVIVLLLIVATALRRSAVLDYGHGLHVSLIVTSSLAIAAYLAWTIAVTVRHLLRAEIVDADMIWGGLSVYLMLGTAFSLLFLSMEQLRPGSFMLHGRDTGADAGVFLYFSLETLTTLGTGDVLPMTRAARVLSVFEALLGQFFLAVLIGSLIARKGVRPKA
jgi:hypothetical protein